MIHFGVYMKKNVVFIVDVHRGRICSEPIKLKNGFEGSYLLRLTVPNQEKFGTIAIYFTGGTRLNASTYRGGISIWDFDPTNKRIQSRLFLLPLPDKYGILHPRFKKTHKIIFTLQQSFYLRKKRIARRRLPVWKRLLLEQREQNARKHQYITMVMNDVKSYHQKLEASLKYFQPI